jgi:hypothetical protein
VIASQHPIVGNDLKGSTFGDLSTKTSKLLLQVMMKWRALGEMKIPA